MSRIPHGTLQSKVFFASTLTSMVTYRGSMVTYRGLSFTDPPYDEEWFPLHESLEKIAFRKLKEGQVLSSMEDMTPQIFKYMENFGLEYWLMLVAKRTG